MKIYFNTNSKKINLSNLGMLIFLLVSTFAHAANSLVIMYPNALHNDNLNYVRSNRTPLAQYFPWAQSQSVGILAACPQNVTIAAAAGECSKTVDFDFDLAPLVPAPVDLTASQNNSNMLVNGTVYCAVGQTKYRRTFRHFGVTDLSIHTIRMGVYSSVNNPVVTVNIYDNSNTLLTSTSNPVTVASGFFNFAVTPTSIAAGASYTVEIVSPLPQVAVFKMGRNNSGNLIGFSEAVIVSNSCTSGTLTVEGNIMANSVVFSVIGTPDDFKINKLPVAIGLINNTLNSGDEFPIGVSNMHYNVVTANSNIILDCAFTITVSPFAGAIGAIACNDLVNVSLGENCETVVTPEMLLQGDTYGCYDTYTVSIKSLTGAPLGNKVTKANVGQKLEVTITGPNGNRCWGYILVEDKFGPDLTCNDIYATCSTDLSPGSPLSLRVPVTANITDGSLSVGAPSQKSFTITVANLADATITDLNVFLDITHTRVSDLAATLTDPNGNTITLFINPGGACTNDNVVLTLDDEAANDYVTLGTTCDIVDPTISGTFQPQDVLSLYDGQTLEGDWVVTVYDLVAGDGGNVNHIDLIFSQTGGSIPFPTTNVVTFTKVDDRTYAVNGVDQCGPATLTYTDTVVEESCQSIYSQVIRRCWTGRDAINNPASACCQTIYVYRNGLSTLQFPPNYDAIGTNPQPLSCADYGSLVPPTSVTGIPTGDLCSNVQLAPVVDVRIDICANSYKIIRTHKVIEWCSGQVLLHNQIIKVVDDRGPEMNCPANTTISTDSYACSATYIVPRPVITKECSKVLVYALAHATEYDEDYESEFPDEDQFNTTGVDQASETITGLALGTNYIRWSVTDECGNASGCVFEVVVEDKVLPNAVCDHTTTVAITGNGKALVNALTFDDGSIDNCGISRYEARKMTDVCKGNPDISLVPFTETIEFCCDEVNTTIMVEFRVTDRFGNSNTCMVEVKVQDKLPPYITKCPADITLDCQADFKDLKITGEPEYRDNCTVVSVKSQDNVQINQCGVGTVTRTWTVEDKQGFRNSCVQIITLNNKDPFYYNINNESDPRNDIVWPRNYETFKCHSVLDPKNLPIGFDRPVVSDNNCSLVAMTYKDQVFKFVDGACEKIIRTWTVIDWCTYNDANPQYGQGLYEKIQIIKLKNDIAPDFEFACVDRTFAAFGNCEGPIDFTMTAIDDCPESNTNLVWKYELDIDNNGTIDQVVNSDRFNRTIKVGVHQVKWTVEDKCGNRAFCTHTITVLERKKPTPYCLSSITTAVMNSNGTIAIWAKDYDLGSFDNCTPTGSLIFTFFGATPVVSKLNVQHYFKASGVEATLAEYNAGNAQIWIPAQRSSGILFDCADIPNGKLQEVLLDMTVTDLAGNQDYCTVKIILQDNANVCPDNNQPLIGVSGRIVPANSVGMPGVEVIMQSSTNTELNKSIYSDQSGSYIFANLPKAADFNIRMSDNRDLLNGVSTLDLVMIQRHLLGIDVLNDPKKIIAADVDNNGRVSAADLSTLRKAILGITAQFPSGQRSWRFVTSINPYVSNINPFPFNEIYAYSKLSDGKIGQNFLPIKIGDINESATYNANEVKAQTRSNTTLALNYEVVTNKNGETEVQFHADGFEKISGFQYTLGFNPNELQLVRTESGELIINESNFGMNLLSSGKLSTSWNDDESKTISADKVLFKLIFRGSSEVNLSLNSEVTHIEAFDDQFRVMNVTLRQKSSNSFAEVKMYQNTPNPFVDMTSITFELPKAADVKLTFTDVNGRLLKSIQDNYDAGAHNVRLHKSELGSTGVIIYHIESLGQKISKKMICVE